MVCSSDLKLDKADIVVFGGGSDVNPILYGEDPLPGTIYNDERDAWCMNLWRNSEDKLKIGICRGGQFLNVMNGGKLWQHVDQHGRSHQLKDEFTGEKWHVSSTHHQMFRPARDAIVVATARETTFKQAYTTNWKLKNDNTPVDNFMKKDIEVLYYPGTMSLCFQPHPEYITPPSTKTYFGDVYHRMVKGTLEEQEAERKAKIAKVAV